MIYLLVLFTWGALGYASVYFWLTKWHKDPYESLVQLGFSGRIGIMVAGPVTFLVGLFLDREY